MDPLDTMVLLSLVKPSGHRWPLELAIVTRLAQLRGGGFLSGPIAAEWTGASDVTCRRALLSLERRRIIQRDAGESGRDHIRWCSVSADWRRWRVEWLLDPSQIAAQLAYAAQQREESPLTRIFARSYSARSVARIARSHDARSWESDLAEVAGIARHSSARSSDSASADRALLIARSLGRRRAVLERAILGTGPKEVLLPRDGEEDLPTSGSGGRKEAELDQPTRQLRGRVLSMAVPAPGSSGVYLKGPPLWRLAALVSEHGAPQVHAALDRIQPGTASPLRIVEMIEDLVLAPEVPAPVDHIDPAARVSHLERIIATYRAEGAEPPEGLVAELAEWQTGPDAPEEVPA